MITWKPDFAVISDISANIFAVFVLILLIMLASGQPLRESAPAPQGPARIDAAADLVTIERAPLRPAQIVDLLHERLAPGWSIDLFESRIEVSGAGQRVPVVLDFRRDGITAMVERFDQLMRAGARGTPARLYVFNNRWYARVSAGLARHGIARREMSVPLALRSRADATAGDAWSDGFLELSRRQLDRDRFRDGLARLLAGGAAGGAAGGGGGGKAGGGKAGGGPPVLPAPFGVDGGESESLIERLLRVLKILVGLVALAVAFAAVAVIERRFVRRPPLPSGPEFG